MRILLLCLLLWPAESLDKAAHSNQLAGSLEAEAPELAAEVSAKGHISKRLQRPEKASLLDTSQSEPKLLEVHDAGIPPYSFLQEDIIDVSPGNGVAGVVVQGTSSGEITVEAETLRPLPPRHHSAVSQPEVRAGLMRREVSGQSSPKQGFAQSLLSLLASDHSEEKPAKEAFRGKLCVLGLIAVLAVLAVVQATELTKQFFSDGLDTAGAEPAGADMQSSQVRSRCRETEMACNSARTNSMLVTLPCASARKNKKDAGEGNEATSDPTGGLRCKIRALQVTSGAKVEELLPSSGDYDVTFSKPLSSRQLVRLEVCIEGPVDGAAALLAPLSKHDCVLYTAQVSRKGHGGMALPVAYASQHVDFAVSLLHASKSHPVQVVHVTGSEVNFYAVDECRISQVTPFPCAPDHWQDFVSIHASAAPGPNGARALTAELRAQGSAVDFQECALRIGARVTVVGELVRSASGELILQRQERASFKCVSLENEEDQPPDSLNLIEARTHVLVTDDSALLSAVPMLVQDDWFEDE